MNPGRYYLLLTAGGRPVTHGWWNNAEIARGKFRDCVGLYGGTLPDARIALTDEETGDQLAAWPDDSPGVVGGES